MYLPKLDKPELTPSSNPVTAPAGNISLLERLLLEGEGLGRVRGSSGEFVR